MADYVFIQNYSKNGKMGISHIVFDEIATIASDKVEGVAVSTGKKNSKKQRAFFLHHPVTCDIKNGIVDVNVAVVINSMANVNQVCLKIQEEVANAITSMTELVPFNINVKVTGIE